MNYEKLAEEVLEAVGGKENIKTVAACATRLRFTLKKKSIAKKEVVERITGVLKVIESGGMFQVVIGNDVNKVYNIVVEKIGDTNLYDNSGQKETILNKLISTVASIFGPLFGVMAGAGLIKGLLSMCTTLGWLDTSVGIYQVLNVAGDSFFYFLPVVLAITAARQFKTNEFIAVTLAGALIHPNLVTLFNDGTSLDFVGIPVVLMKYSSTVLPIIAVVWVLSKIERFLRSYLHTSIRNLLTPFLCLSIMVPATLIVLGPIGTFMAETIAEGFSAIYGTSPILAGVLLGGLWQVLVIFGVHWGITAVVFNNLALLGYDAIGPLYAPSLSAQAGSAFGVYLKTKNQKLKEESLSATITAIFGITEPAIYGVNLKLKKPFYYAVIAGAIGGAIGGASGATAVSFVTKTIFTLPAFMGTGFILYVIAFISPFFISLAMTLILGFDDLKEERVEIEVKNDNILVNDERVISPLKGTLFSLNEVKDDVFSKEIVGKGIAILPTEGKVIAPFDGTVKMVFPTLHAYGLVSDNGAEMLIHIGLDTVKLDGKYFKSFVKDGDRIKTGDIIGGFDIEKIMEEGYDMSSEIVITNTKDYANVVPLFKGDAILELTK